MDLRDHPRIEIDPQRMSGAPVIRGTRVPVYVLLEFLADGFSIEDIVSERHYPWLKPDDVRAALRFAADMSAASLPRAAAE